MVTLIRKPGAAVRAAGGSQGTDPPESGPQRTLASLLEMAFGGADAADAAIAHALVLAGRDELPTTGGELMAFVRAHLLTPLSDQIGPRLTMALVDDLVAQLDPGADAPAPDSSIPPSSVPRPVGRMVMHPGSSPRARGPELGVLLVDADRVGRTTLARAMLRAQSNVTLVDTVDDLAAVINAEDVIDVVLVDATHASAQAIVELLAKHRPEAAVVARSNDVARTRALLAQLGVTRFDVRSREAPSEELIDAVKRAAGR
jgi:hypothetical protein